MKTIYTVWEVVSNKAPVFFAELNEEANNSQSLERVFEDEVKSEVRKRLSADTDYSSEKFPSIHKYFEKDEKR